MAAIEILPHNHKVWVCVVEWSIEDMLSLRRLNLFVVGVVGDNEYYEWWEGTLDYGENA